MSTAQPDRLALRLLRRRLVVEIERLITLLDEIDGDPDFEPDADHEVDADHEETAPNWTGDGPQRFDRGVAA